MNHPGGSAIGKTAFAVGGMGLTALVALAVGGPLAAATVAVAGRVLGEALGESGKALTETFVGKANDYFFDAAGEPLIDGFRVEHPTLEDIYCRALQLSLNRLRPAAPNEKQKKTNAKEYDWFGYWELALKSGISFSASGIKLPRNSADADASFKAAMEILAAQGAMRLRNDTSLTLKTELLPEGFFQQLKADLPDQIDHFFNSLLVQDDNTTAYKEHDLIFKEQFLASFSRIEKEVHEMGKKVHEVGEKVHQVGETTTAIREGQALVGEQIAAMSKRLEELYNIARIKGDVPELAPSELKQELINAKELIRKLKQQLADRSSELAHAEPKDAELSKALGANDLEAALQIKTRQLEKRNQDVTGLGEEEAKLPRDYFELGQIHEARFEWPQALEAYRRAWEHGGDSKHGFYYALFAQKLNHFSEAAAVYEDLLRACKEPTIRAMTLHNLATVYSNTQRRQKAEDAYGEALTAFRKLAEANPDEYLPNVATTLNNLGILYYDTRRMQKAEQAYLDALAVRRKLAETKSDAYLNDVATTLNNLAVLYNDTKRKQNAEDAYGEALAAFGKLAEANPDGVATTRGNLAILYIATQRKQKAEQEFGKALDIRRKLAEANPDANLPGVASMLNNLATLYRDTQRMQEARQAYGEALAVQRKLVERNPDAYLPDVAFTLNNLATLYGATNHIKEAEQAYLDALTIRRKLAETDPAYLPDVALTLNNLANLYGATQSTQEAEQACLDALTIRRKLAETDPAYLPDVALTLNTLAMLYRAAQSTQEAELACSEAERILDPLWGANPELHGNEMAKLLWTRALLSEARGEPGKACALARRGLAAVYDPVVRQWLQQIIDRLAPTTPASRAE